MVITCLHPTSLIYFDRCYGQLTSWEVCDDCGETFNQQTPKSADEAAYDRSFTEWLEAYRNTAGSQNT